jgi:phage terminase large subunit-like protein
MGEKFKATRFMLPTSSYDEDKAEYVVDFIENLKHTKGEWHNKPFILLPWQKEIIRNLFGVVKEDGYRQFTTGYVEIPKKQGKTELGAAIALYMLIADGEWGAEVYSCAADRAQASLIYQVAVDMIGLSPALRKRLKIVGSQKRIVYPAMNSFYQVLSSEAFSKHGINPHAVLFDETHVANREMFNVMTHGAADARRQPVNFLITTAGNNRHSIGFEVHQKAVDILEGRKYDQSFYPTIYGAKDDEDWTDPKVWRKANPSLDVTVPEEKMAIACENAKQNPAEENLFRQLRLNQWVKQSIRWMPMDKWDDCDETVNIDLFVGRECYAGLDLSTTLDLTAFVLVFPPRNETEKYIIVPHFWIPEDNLKKRVNRDHVPYDVWEVQGHIRTTPGNVVDYRRIEADIKEIASKFVIKEIAYDRYNATQIILNLQDEGLIMVPFGQGFKDMSPPTKEIFTLVLKNRIIHNHHPVLRWNFDNVHIETDAAENIKPSKKHSTERIDGAVASIMALDRAVRNGGYTGSVYDERGLVII